jgi:hypothetical protein
MRGKTPFLLQHGPTALSGFVLDRSQRLIGVRDAHITELMGEDEKPLSDKEEADAGGADSIAKWRSTDELRAAPSHMAVPRSTASYASDNRDY